MRVATQLYPKIAPVTANRPASARLSAVATAGRLPATYTTSGDTTHPIPAPLRIRRHAGATDLQTLATEILGLPKMNWNSLDLYTQLPATLETSGQIARIGRLMENFGEANYDCRLLMQGNAQLRRYHRKAPPTLGPMPWLPLTDSSRRS